MGFFFCINIYEHSLYLKLKFKKCKYLSILLKIALIISCLYKITMFSIKKSLVVTVPQFYIIGKS